MVFNHLKQSEPLLLCSPPERTELDDFSYITAKAMPLQYEIHTNYRRWINALAPWVTDSFSQHWMLIAAIEK